MAILIANQPVSLPVGSTRLGPLVIPDELTSLYATLAYRTAANPAIWPLASTTLLVKFSLSLDGGSTYQPHGGTGSFGGLHTDEDGVEMPHADVRLSPLPEGVSRRLVVDLVVAGGTLNSRLTVEAT